MKRKEILHKRTKLSQEINDLIKTRGKKQRWYWIKQKNRTKKEVIRIL